MPSPSAHSRLPACPVQDTLTAHNAQQQRSLEATSSDVSQMRQRLADARREMARDEATALLAMQREAPVLEAKLSGYEVCMSAVVRADMLRFGYMPCCLLAAFIFTVLYHPIGQMVDIESLTYDSLVASRGQLLWMRESKLWTTH